MLELIEGGAQRKDAYEAVQRNAMEAWQGGAGFKELVSKDSLITKYLTAEQIESCFDPKHYLRHLDKIYQRVFGGNIKKGNKVVIDNSSS